MADKPPLHDAHLHPLTLAFDAGLRAGTVSLEVAEIFVDRVFEAWLEARVRANPRELKDYGTTLAHRAITGGGNEAADED